MNNFQEKVSKFLSSFMFRKLLAMLIFALMMVCCIILAHQKKYSYLFVFCTMTLCATAGLIADIVIQHMMLLLYTLFGIEKYLKSDESTAEYIRMDLGHIVKAVRDNKLKVICCKEEKSGRKHKKQVATKATKHTAESKTKTSKKKRGRPKKEEAVAPRLMFHRSRNYRR